MTTAIKIENLAKQYRLGEVGTGTISHDLNRWWARIRGKEDPFSTVGQVNQRDKAADGDYVWALKDVNLEVEQGEVLGIIGANGAGKSTLLKLISRITSPTAGNISARGRIASLLEVGTGMHPEMTARENIYLNGSILGMRRHEISRKFDDIIDFAGCRMFVDTPVKRFSSGMRVRLGFAVAAFLEPETLIVDEVLAVGDNEFQNRAVEKMKSVSNDEGRTILFVSHNLNTVATLCSSTAVLEAGSIAFRGETGQAITRYLRQRGDACRQSESSNGISLESLRVRSGGQEVSTLLCGDSVTFEIRYRNRLGISGVECAVVLNDGFGNRVAVLGTQHDPKVMPFSRTSGTLTCHVDSLPLVPAQYIIDIVFAVPGQGSKGMFESAGTIDVTFKDLFGTGILPNKRQGALVLASSWTSTGEQA